MKHLHWPEIHLTTNYRKANIATSCKDHRAGHWLWCDRLQLSGSHFVMLLSCKNWTTEYHELLTFSQPSLETHNTQILNTQDNCLSLISAAWRTLKMLPYIVSNWTVLQHSVKQRNRHELAPVCKRARGPLDVRDPGLNLGIRITTLFCWEEKWPTFWR